MFAKKVKLVTHFDSNFPMQAHPEFSVQGFQYRENTVSLYPTPSYFPPHTHINNKKYTCSGFTVMKWIHEQIFNECLLYRQGTVLVQEVKYPLL